MPPNRDAMFLDTFSQPISQQKDIRQIRDRDVFEAKLWLERTCHAARIKTGPMRPPSSIVYSCCNSAGIFPHSYGNVLGLIERSQLGFGIYLQLLQVSVLLQWKTNPKPHRRPHDINFTPNRAKNVLRPSTPNLTKAGRREAN